MVLLLGNNLQLPRPPAIVYQNVASIHPTSSRQRPRLYEQTTPPSPNFQQDNDFTEREKKKMQKESSYELLLGNG